MPLVIPPMHMTSRERREWYRANGLTPPARSASDELTPLERKRARQVRYYLRRKARGLCKHCDNPIEGEHARCADCLEARRRKEAGLDAA